MNEHRGRWGLAAGVLTLLIASGVWWGLNTVSGAPDQERPDPLPTPAVTAPTASGTPAATGTPAAPEPRTVGVYVYFAAREFPNLVRELKQVPAATPAHGALEAMLAGPDDPDSINLWNPRTRILGISQHDDVITVDLSKEAGVVTLDSDHDDFLIDQMVYTITEAFSPTDKVRVLVEGEPFATRNHVYDQPLQRREFGDQIGTMLLTIDTPAQGSTVDSVVRVTGLARAYEGFLYWSVTGPDGSAVADGTARADHGTTLSPFAFDLPPLEPGAHVVTVTLDDPSDGESGWKPTTENKEFTVR